MKATSIGSKSLEHVEGAALSPRQQVDFECPANHRFTIVFSDQAELPTSWECPTCWVSAARSDGVLAVVPLAKPVRTHWDMLRERRSVAELEEILAERLALLRSGVVGPGSSQGTALAGKKTG